VASASALDIDIALDIAFQCAPDHPYVNEHRAWFKWRPDGTVQYAENPPKKYQDIYPFDFESEDWPALWEELKSVFLHWIDAGVRVFRVDNPHTKAFAFWEWVIGEIKAAYPDVIFLSEAFTRPKVMHRLAKLGFTQSYTYFTWRQSAQELQAYFTELAHGPGQDYFRPNVWPNTPDILHKQFHHAGCALFALRLVLAATLSPNYGIYGPAYELMENRPRQPGSEEYLDSEKYQLRHWGELSLTRTDSLAGFISLINRVRREHPAFQTLDGLRFHDTDNTQLLAYSRTDASGQDTLLVIVNLDDQHAQSGWLMFDPVLLGLPPNAPFTVHDLITGQQFSWQGQRHFIMLAPATAPAHICHILRPDRSSP
jgi:starch synthase (maltosyl-transferring)